MNTNPQPPRKVLHKDIFETQVCSRCDGSGHYSWNAMTGSRCFGCGGRGWQLTKRGAAALEAWTAAWKQTKKVRDLQPGERVSVRDSVRGKVLYLTVESSEADDLNPGRWMVRFAPGQALGGYGFMNGDNEIDLPVSIEDKRVAYETISNLPGATGWKEAA